MGRALRKLSPIAVPAKASLDDLLHTMEGALKQVADENRTSILEHLGLVGPGPGRHSVPLLTDCDRSLLKDDCESSAQLAVLCRMAILSAPDTVDGLQKLLEEWPMFKNFTPRCYSLLSQIVNRGAQMLRSGALKVTTAVGLATSAAASDVQKLTAEFSGHCFNVACVTTPPAPAPGLAASELPAMDKLSFAIMEGTAPSCSILVSETTPQIPVKIWQHPGNPKGFTTKIMSFNQYCNALAQGVNELTRVINAPNGGRVEGGGWPIHGAAVTGWTSTQVLMNSLDSDPESYLEFYNRVVYMGWKCSPGASGCMPIERCQATPAGGHVPATPQFLTGCHPYHLNDRTLQAIDAFVPSDKQPVMDAIMDEAHPPLVDEAALKRLSEYWAPCSPFSDVNNQRRFITSREEGVEYVRVACMETPGIPEFVPLVCLAKHTAFKLADKINMERADSDGARFVSEDRPQGTGFHGFLEIPCKAVIPTAINSLRRALKMLNWPGYVCMGEE